MSSPVFAKPRTPAHDFGTSRSGALPFDWRTLHGDLLQIVEDACTEQELLDWVVELARSLSGALLVVYYRTDEAGNLRPARESSPVSDTSGLRMDAECLPRFAAIAHEHKKLAGQDVGNAQQVLALPVFASSRTDVLCVLLPQGAQAVETAVSVLQMLIGHVALWHERQTARAFDRDATNSAALLELAGDVAGSSDTAAAARMLAQRLREFLDCDIVAVGLPASDGQACRLAALSGVDEFDPSSEMARACEAALRECWFRNTPGKWPPPSTADRHLLVAHERLSELGGGCRVRSLPIRGAAGNPVSALLLMSTTDWNPRCDSFLSTCSETLGSFIDAASRAKHGSIFGRWCSAAWLPRTLRRRLIWAAAIAAVCTLALPVHYRVPCQCVLEPVVRRFVAAPYDGIFEKSLVKPGDVVEANQVLGRLDGRELRYEAAGLAAEQNRAAKSRDVSMASGKVATAQISKLEMDRLEQKRRLLLDRLEHLEIKSPLAGMVISGDLERSQGVPVTVGQVLYEVAPITQMVAEVAIADEDRSYARLGQTVRIELDAYSDEVLTGRLSRIHPRSETRDDDNVFIGEVVLDNPRGILKPGMRGRAKIVTDRQPLAWIVLHRPLERLAAWIGW